MTLTDTQRFWVMLRDAGSQGVHSFTARRAGLGNPSQRAKDAVDKGQPILTARENVGKRPGSRYWLAPHAPDWATPVRPNNDVELGGEVTQENPPSPGPAVELSAERLFEFPTRRYADPEAA